MGRQTFIDRWADNNTSKAPFLARSVRGQSLQESVQRMVKTRASCTRKIDDEHFCIGKDKIADGPAGASGNSNNTRI
jgi:hypothetical protein